MNPGKAENRKTSHLSWLPVPWFSTQGLDLHWHTGKRKVRHWISASWLQRHLQLCDYQNDSEPEAGCGSSPLSFASPRHGPPAQAP